MGLNLLTTLARNLLTGGTPQQPATIQREAEQLQTKRIADVNAAVNEQQGEPTPVTREALGELSAAETTAPPVATTISTKIPAPTDTAAVAKTNLAETTPAAIELRISQTAVETLKPILLAFKGLVKSLLLGNEDAYSTVTNFLLTNEDTLKPVKNFLLQNEGIVKPILLNLSQENSKLANAQAVPNPA